MEKKLKIALLTINFYLPGCGSLKEKRQRVIGLKDKFGKTINIAVCEGDYLDVHERAEFTFTCVGNTAKPMVSSLAKIVDYCCHNVDAQVTNHETIWL